MNHVDPSPKLLHKGDADRVLSIIATLSRCEIEVLGELAKKLSDREIASRLRIATPDVKRCLDGILAKTGCENRSEAAVFGMNCLVELLKRPNKP